MPQSKEKEEELVSLLFPALNILRGIEIGLQEHECFYANRIKEATRNLCKLLEKLK